MTAVEMVATETNNSSLVSPQEKAMSIVLATDGSDASVAALYVARLMCADAPARVSVISVLEPMPLIVPAPDAMAIPPDMEAARLEAQRATVDSQIGRYDFTGRWSLDIRMGQPAESIVEFAHEREADLIIVGLNKHGVIGRLFGEETAIDIARLSDVPLLVAAPNMKRLPKRVMVAMDLNPEGLQGAPEALASLADATSISCVHVKPRSEMLGIDWAQYDAEYELAVRERFKEVEARFCSVGLRPDLVVLHGDPAHELAEYAAYSKAELIVVGVKRRQGRARAVGGRVAARVLRKTSCGVLVVPNIAATTAGI